ncbi:hypothetical protein KAR91_48715 [Candidatus Pacearchaeota archaeon]|nr:hypothetical protein [Candidatus Pacearchaeota archaeon]
MTFGLTADGFTIKRESDIIVSLEEGYKAEFGEINVDAAALFGQIIGVTSKPLAELWELAEHIYLAYSISADGISLDNVVQLTGLTRLGPTKTTVTGILIGVQGTSVLTGNSASVDEIGEIFFTTEDVTIDKANVLRCEITVDTVLNIQLYTITIDGDPHTFTSDVDATAQEITTGLASNINSGQSKVTADGSDETLAILVNDSITSFSVVVDANLSLDEIATPVEFEAQNAGAVLAVAGSLTNIETPVVGWDNVDNLIDGDIGNDTETNTALRIRRELSLRVLGAATIPAIQARILQEVANVSTVKVTENDSQTYNETVIITVDTVTNSVDYSIYINGFEYTYTSDASATSGEITAGLAAIINTSSLAITATDNMDGTVDVDPAQEGIIFSFSHNTRMSLSGATPPHNIHCVVNGGIDQAVGDKIWEVKAGGIGTHGNTNVIVEDTEGDEHLIKLSRPTPKYAWADVAVTLNPEEDFPSDGLAQIQANMQALGISLGIGDDYILQKFYTPIYVVAGVASVVLKIATTDSIFGPPALVTTNISISNTEELDFSDIAKLNVYLA